VRNRQSGLFLRYARSRITQSNLTDNLGSGIVADRSHTTISNSNITTNKNIGLKLTGPGELYFDHSILAGNTSAQSGVIQNVDFSNKTDAFTIGSNICDTDPPFLSSASDKTLADPKLTPLAGYGENIGSPSPLATSNLLCQLPLHNSPAIDASQSPIQIDTTGTDLRGTPRIEDGDNNGSASLDSGAVEALPFVTVNTTADENSSPPGANTSLREALGLSQPHRIVFATSLNGQTINLSSNAGGQGVTLHRTHRHAVVDASMLSSSITVSGNGDMTQPLIGPQAYHGVTFANGRASVARIFSGTLILTHCHLNSNSQQANTNPLSYDQNGGAIFNAGSAYIIDTTFSGNHCVNEDNSAASGGAYASFPHEGAVFGKPIVTNYLIRCKFLNNVADSNAGAIYIAGGRKAIVDSCIISGNQANNIGGVSLLASQFDSSYVELTRTSVIRNRAENNSGVVLNGASAIGSGVPERIERITMSYCTVSGNSGSSSSRGAVSTSGVNLTIDHSTIVNNTGEFQAGISLRDSSTVNIRNS
ncbi:MAG: choice-of-anchor Q domain-containing protein, partial [Akkermansiaceae bacterium]